MPSQCDPACMKIIIDTGMSIEAAKLYGAVLADTSDVRAIDRAAPYFYTGVVDLARQVAQAINQGRETDDQKARIAEQIQKECYRAEDIIHWASAAPNVIAEKASAWTELLFAWAREVQDFWTAMAAEIGRGGQ